MTVLQPLPPDRQGVAGEVNHDRIAGGKDVTHWFTPFGRLLARLARQISRRVGSNATFILTLAIGAAIAVLFSVLAEEVYDSVTDKDGVSGLDRPLLEFALTLRSPALNAFATGYTDIAGTVGMPIVAITVLLFLAIRRRSWTPVILIVGAGAGSLLMTIAGKDLIGRHRPPLADAVPPYEYSPSFPSGHTLNATVIAGIIAYVLMLRQQSARIRAVTIIVAVLFAFTVGLSRVFLGHHWFTDVLAGWTLGAAWLALVITAHRLYLTTRRAPDRPDHEVVAAAARTTT